VREGETNEGQARTVAFRNVLKLKVTFISEILNFLKASYGSGT
jgi:hypothetical protein